MATPSASVSSQHKHCNHSLLHSSAYQTAACCSRVHSSLHPLTVCVCPVGGACHPAGGGVSVKNPPTPPSDQSLLLPQAALGDVSCMGVAEPAPSPSAPLPQGQDDAFRLSKRSHAPPPPSPNPRCNPRQEGGAGGPLPASTPPLPRIPYPPRVAGNPDWTHRQSERGTDDWGRCGAGPHAVGLVGPPSLPLHQHPCSKPVTSTARPDRPVSAYSACSQSSKSSPPEGCRLQQQRLRHSATCDASSLVSQLQLRGGGGTRQGRRCRRRRDRRAQGARAIPYRARAAWTQWLP